MRNAALGWSVLFLLSSLSSPAAGAPSSWRIVPGARLGAVTARSTFGDLVRLYGRSNLVRKTLVSRKGENVLGVVLFPKNPEKRVEIAWSDSRNSRYPAWARLRGQSGSWKTPGGLTLGTRLAELEKMNGRAFSLWGFDWGEGGMVRSWNGGNLADELKGRVAVGLQPANRANLKADEYRSVVGRRVLPSGDPILRGLDPRVTEITLFFHQEGRGLSYR